MLTLQSDSQRRRRPVGKQLSGLSKGSLLTFYAALSWSRVEARRLTVFRSLEGCSSAGAGLHAHTRVVLEDHVAVLVEVEKRYGSHDIRDTAGRRHVRVQADGVDDTLDGGVVRRAKLLKNRKVDKVL